jgi:hypothetical protein
MVRTRLSLLFNKNKQPTTLETSERTRKLTNNYNTSRKL